MAGIEDLFLRMGYRPPREGARGEARDAAHPAINDIGYGAPSFRTFKIQLGDAFDNKGFDVSGNFLWCRQTSDHGAFCRVAFNEQEQSGGFQVTEGVRISGIPFSKIWVTNPIKQGGAAWGVTEVPSWVELITAATPIEITNPTNRTQVPFSTTIYFESADSAHPAFYNLNAIASSIFLYAPLAGVLNKYTDLGAFETHIQNDPINSTDYMHYRVMSNELYNASVGAAIGTGSMSLDIGETVILPFIPMGLVILSHNAATKVRCNVHIFYKSNA